MASKTPVADPEGIDIFAGTDVEEVDLPEIVPTPLPKKPVHPSLDPSSPHWDPKKFFGQQEKVVIVVPRNESDILSDPTNSHPVTCNPSINGYFIQITKGVPTKVPRSFADHLVDIGAAYRYADLPEVG